MSQKLLFVVNLDKFFLSHRLPVALRALEQGYEVHVATSLTGSKGKLRSLGFTVHPLRLNRKSIGFWSNWITFLELIRLYRQLRPDIVHLVTIKPVLLGGLAARLTKIPHLVVAISGLGYVFSALGFFATLRRWLVLFFYGLVLRHERLTVIFQNEDDHKTLCKFINLPDYKTTFIRGSGVDLNKFLSSDLPLGEPVVVLAARLLVDKGVREFVAAAKILKKSGLSARFVLIGEPDIGNPSTISKKELNEWVSQRVVEWWGHKTNIDTIFSYSYLVVLPSYREGFPKVLMEAASCGRAVVTTDVPGCRDAIEHNVSGLLVKPQSPQDLADAIKRLLDDPILCQNMGKAGRKMAVNFFDENIIAEQHMQIYNHLLTKNAEDFN